MRHRREGRHVRGRRGRAARMRAVPRRSRPRGSASRDSRRSARRASRRDRPRAHAGDQSRERFTATYPPIYYVTIGTRGRPRLQRGIGCRCSGVLNVVIFLGVAVGLYLLLPRQLRSASLWMWLIGLVPLGVFLIASNNPSSWAVISGGTVWLATLGYFTASGWRRWSLLCLRRRGDHHGRRRPRGCRGLRRHRHRRRVRPLLRALAAVPALRRAVHRGAAGRRALFFASRDNRVSCRLD